MIKSHSKMLVHVHVRRTMAAVLDGADDVAESGVQVDYEDTLLPVGNNVTYTYRVWCSTPPLYVLL